MTTSSFVFICGLHRSGTSILFRSLRDHPDISGFTHTGVDEDEGMHLQTVYRPSGYFGSAGRFGFHPDAHMTEGSLLVSEQNRKRLFEEWSRYWDLSKPFLLEKSPPNLIRTRFLQAMFPQSYFIILMRHPIPVSYATRAWYKIAGIHTRTLHRLIEHWLTCHEIFWSEKHHLANYMILKYEHFVTNPEQNLTRVYDFLGVKPHPSDQRILSTVNDKYFSKWKNDEKGLLTKPFLNSIKNKFEDRANAFGYSLKDLRVNDPIPQAVVGSGTQS